MSSTLPANARVSTNPFLESKLNHLRDRSLGSSAVRATTAEIARILAVEATQNHKPDHGKIGLIVVLRSGLGMSDAFLAQFAPDTDVVVYHIGMFREKYSLQPVEYYNKLPNNNTEIKRVYVVDPLIATGGTATAVIEILRYVWFPCICFFHPISNCGVVTRLISLLSNLQPKLIHNTNHRKLSAETGALNTSPSCQC